jgi:hypothetical protein
MKRLLIGTVLLGGLLGMRAGAAADVSYTMSGDQMEACSCSAPCPCHFEMDTTLGHCDGTTGWRINSGHYGDLDLSGVKFVLQAFIGKNMVREVKEQGGVEAAVYFDAKTTPAQREAVMKIMGEQMKGFIRKMNGPYVAPIIFKPVDESGKGSYSIPGVVNVSLTAFRGKDGKWVTLANAPASVISPEHLGKAELNSYNEPRLSKQWRHTGTHANFGTFTYSNEGGEKADRSATSPK